MEEHNYVEKNSDEQIEKQLELFLKAKAFSLRPRAKLKALIMSSVTKESISSYTFRRVSTYRMWPHMHQFRYYAASTLCVLVLVGGVLWRTVFLPITADSVSQVSLDEATQEDASIDANDAFVQHQDDSVPPVSDVLSSSVHI